MRWMEELAEAQLVFGQLLALPGGDEPAIEEHLSGARVFAVDVGNQLLPAQLKEMRSSSPPSVRRTGFVLIMKHHCRPVGEEDAHPSAP